MKYLCFFLFFIKGYANSEYSLAFVHIGDVIPSYIYTTLKQARFMNDACSIYFLINETACKNLKVSQSDFLGQNQITLVDVSLVSLTPEHQLYRDANRFSLPFRGGFWNHVTERFFYIHDFMVDFNLENLIQIETDVMLYVDVSELMAGLKQLEVRVGAPFEWKARCIASFVFFENGKAAESLTSHIISEILLPNNNYEANLNDMCTLASFREKKGEACMTPLPVIMPKYGELYSPSNVPFDHGDTTLEFLSKNYDAFKGYIFDAAALGIYVKGYDRRNGANYVGGAIHPKSFFDPSKFKFFWGQDPKGRVVPYVGLEETVYRVINLHFHSKLPEEYTSYGDERVELPK